MAKSVVNPVYEQSANEVYAKGGFRPRRKGERFRHLYNQFPMFANQQGQVASHLEVIPNPIAQVVFLGTFLGYGSYSEEITYRAFKVTLLNGEIVAAYSRNTDTHVMCLHTGYVW